MKTFEEMRCTL